MNKLKSKLKDEGYELLDIGGKKESDGSNYATAIILVDRRDGTFATWQVEFTPNKGANMEYGAYFKSLAKARKNFEERAGRNMQ